MLFGYLFVLPALAGQNLFAPAPCGAIDIETIENFGV
jgi:hypothetical protein